MCRGDGPYRFRGGIATQCLRDGGGADHRSITIAFRKIVAYSQIAGSRLSLTTFSKPGLATAVEGRLRPASCRHRVGMAPRLLSARTIFAKQTEEEQGGETLPPAGP